MDKKERIEQLILKCYNFLQIRPRSEKEISDYLTKKESDSSIIGQVIAQLKSVKYIDDIKFVDWWVQERSYFKPRGIRILRAELRLKGISSAILDQYFEEQVIDELQLAVKELTRVRRKFEKWPSPDKYQKAIQYLLRRGFTYSTSKKAFEELYKIE